MPPYVTPDESRFRASLRRSRERRAAAARTRRVRRDGRAGIALTLGVLLLGTSGALAHRTGGAEAGKRTASARVAGVALAMGSTGKRVIALQRRIGVAADGVFGRRTRAALRRFQARRGLPVTGVADAATLAALGLGARTAGATAPSGAAPTRREARILARIARCESGGDPTAIGGGGRYRGKYQFTRATWRAMGGSGDPAAAPEAEQDQRALALLRREGTSPWPSCA